MLVADTPAPGLMPNPGPDPSSIPNNHLAYAVQWFLFAGLALLIYALALRKRLKDTAT
jgi:surfeit locus 1 family protein